ncbi:hypothetical protein C1H46_016531 [Malus baccata]|uniref:Uncharacterized protein n=1 Tax=Malus baccata TaxID=106549 RepID=A0A540MGG4_MALBA|nr:hypothetical protein C1H46_016531 [Malus baccata]
MALAILTLAPPHSLCCLPLLAVLLVDYHELLSLGYRFSGFVVVLGVKLGIGCWCCFHREAAADTTLADESDKFSGAGAGVGAHFSGPQPCFRWPRLQLQHPIRPLELECELSFEDNSRKIHILKFGFRSIFEDSEFFISKMAKLSCFSAIVRGKKKLKGDESTRSGELRKAIETLHVRLQQQPVKSLEMDGKSKPETLGVLIPFGVEKKYSSPSSGNTRSPKSPIGCVEAVEAAAYEGESEHEESPIARGNSFNDHSDLQLDEANSGEVTPKLVYLNKQSIKPQRARGVVTDSVAKAALGNKGWNPRRKSSKKLSQRSASFKNTHALPSKKSSSFPTHGHNTGASVVQQNLSKTKSMVRVSSELPSSSH